MTQLDKPLCGFLNVLKPPGMSSGAAVAMVKRLTGLKVGHCGTLDPEASGILPIMVGRATRLFDFMVEKEKTYLAEVAFGFATDTQDAQGVAIASGENYPAMDAVCAAAQQLTDLADTCFDCARFLNDGKRTANNKNKEYKRTQSGKSYGYFPIITKSHVSSCHPTDT